MHSSSVLLSLLSLRFVTAATVPKQAELPTPSRYNNPADGVYLSYDYLYYNYNLPDVPFQAQDGQIVFHTPKNPARIPPYATYEGAANFTAYYFNPPSLQLYTSSSFVQQVYVDRDLSLRYQRLGEPLPIGANATCFTSIGGPGSFLAIQGHVTQLNGTKTYFSGQQLCRFQNGEAPNASTLTPGPFAVYAEESPANFDYHDVHPWKGCVETELSTSINDTKVAPGLDAYFYVPEGPAAFAYA